MLEAFCHYFLYLIIRCLGNLETNWMLIIGWLRKLVSHIVKEPSKNQAQKTPEKFQTYKQTITLLYVIDTLAFSDNMLFLATLNILI